MTFYENTNFSVFYYTLGTDYLIFGVEGWDFSSLQVIFPFFVKQVIFLSNLKQVSFRKEYTEIRKVTESNTLNSKTHISCIVMCKILRNEEETAFFNLIDNILFFSSSKETNYFLPKIGNPPPYTPRYLIVCPVAFIVLCTIE